MKVILTINGVKQESHHNTLGACRFHLSEIEYSLGDATWYNDYKGIKTKLNTFGYCHVFDIGETIKAEIIL